MATTTASLPLSAEFLQNLGKVAQDKEMLAKVVKYVKRLVKKKEDPTLMTKEEFFANVDEAMEQARQGKVHRMLPGESLDDFLNRVRHPRTGTGHPEQLKGDRSGQWSRHITQKHRLIYTINDHVVTVLVLTAYGHYDDK